MKKTYQDIVDDNLMTHREFYTEYGDFFYPCLNDNPYNPKKCYCDLHICHSCGRVDCICYTLLEQY